MCRCRLCLGGLRRTALRHVAAHLGVGEKREISLFFLGRSSGAPELPGQSEVPRTEVPHMCHFDLNVMKCQMS